MMDLRRNKQDRVTASYWNAIQIVRNDDTFRAAFRYNQFSRRVEFLDPETDDLRGLIDADLLNFRLYAASAYEVEFTTAMMADAVNQVAHEFKYHPVRDYLLGLKWDGLPRLRNLLTDYFRCDDEDGLSGIMGVRFMVGAVARVFKPGCKLDTMLIIQGEQGAMKSTALATLGGEWFSDATLDLKHKDASVAIEGVWLHEFGELESVRKADATLIKAWLSRRVERYRPAYARCAEDVPRQTVFVGTTNEGTFLSDKTGSRRFWVRTVPQGEVCDIPAILRDRDQLWAEALDMYRGGCTWWLSSEEDAIRADGAEQFRVRDPWEDDLNAMRSRLTGLTSAQILDELKVPMDRRSKAHEMRISAIMKAIGFTRRQRRSGKARIWRWEEV